MHGLTMFHHLFRSRQNTTDVQLRTGQSHLKLNYNVQYGNKNYHAAKRKGGDRNRIKANEVKDNEEGKRALVGQTDRTGRR